MINSCTSSYTTSDSETGISKPLVGIQREETFFDVNRGIRGLGNFAPQLLDGSRSGSHVEIPPFAAISQNPDFAENLELALEEVAKREETNQRIEFWLRSGQNTPLIQSKQGTLPQSPFPTQENDIRGTTPFNIISCGLAGSSSEPDETEQVLSQTQDHFIPDLQSDIGDSDANSTISYTPLKRRHTT